jgi:superfamily I DNA and/or RNA helicase
VILSLVQKPTRFLTLNRFNVALSRVRKRLYFLTDRQEFQQAAGNENWECHLLAGDLLKLEGQDDSDSDDEWY